MNNYSFVLGSFSRDIHFNDSLKDIPEIQDSIGHFIQIDFSLVELINNNFSAIQVSAQEGHTELLK